MDGGNASTGGEGSSFSTAAETSEVDIEHEAGSGDEETAVENAQAVEDAQVVTNKAGGEEPVETGSVNKNDKAVEDAQVVTNKGDGKDYVDIGSVVNKNGKRTPS